MDGIGIVINLHLIPRRISPKEWREVYQESLKLVEAYDFMDRIEARRNGLRYFFAQKSKDRPLFMNREGHGWLAVGDLRTGEGTGEFMLSEDIHAYMPDEGTRRQRKDRGEEILLNSLEGMNGVKKPQGCVNIWGNQTRGTDSHIYLLAIACLIVSRFPEAAMVSGDISVGQCRRAVRWANQYLVKEIGLPVTGQMDRLLVRLGSSALPEKDLLNAFYQLTDEAKGTQMGDFLRKEFSREEIYDYYRQRFLPYQAGQRGFARVMKEYLEMGTRGEASLSVIATVAAPRSRAKLIAWTVRLEYRGKLTPITTSSSPTRSRLSKISLAVLADTKVTLSKIRLK